jgi:D-glycero-D-manno-heptose 1,7-bisphosphate phosphatase
LRQAVFLDLLGTLGGDGLGDIRSFTFYPFAAEAIWMLNESGLLAIIVTNHSNIARGLLTMDEFNAGVTSMQAELHRHHATLDAVYCCPHSGSDQCNCRKPLTGMIERAKTEFDIDLPASYVAGDMGSSDIVLAKSICAKGVLVLTGVGKGSLGDFRDTWGRYEADHVAENVLDAVKWILGDTEQIKCSAGL